ncbi:gamma-glutamyltransferase [Microcystis aeruginosa]|uniref:Glutathione hydrolase proenzyme n=1 Tax=Microcystis aeruginosa FD4 TaxID=2686288 RepID=A0A857D7V1_MICAE|nr:gamma-glutamyltransferase [Microcystis aeruginosa]QGZ91309.1 gamma-glutamyltransferase [Microcystis aeruginosa FD4]
MTRKSKGAIAAGHPKTAEAGQLILEMGGNAFDAIVGSILAAFVVEFTLASAGGGGFLLAHTKEKVNTLFDFFCQTPKSKKPLTNIDFYPVAINFGGASQDFHIGRGAIATTGALRGLETVQKKLGKLPFAVVAEPAIEYARQGYILSQYNGFCLSLLSSILLKDREGLKVYAPQGKLLQAGDRCVMGDFANTLEELSKKGVKDFYEGEIAHQIAKDMQEGGYLTLEDLNHYQVLERKPLKSQYRGYEILTNPPPSSGGILLAFALKLLETVNLSALEHLGAKHLQILTEVMALTNQARVQGYDNFIHQEGIAEKFLSPEFLGKYPNKWGSTTHISVIDGEGNAASATFSNGEGSAYTVPGTGIMLNNMIGEADLNPFGFHNWPVDRRLSSMMSPTMILEEGKPRFVLGSGGSNRIRTAILQVISNLIDFRQSLPDAIAASRLHWENQQLGIEPLEDRENMLKNLVLPANTQVSRWQEQNMFFGGVHGVAVNDRGELTATGDPRRDGVGLLIRDF